jgi:hypothetical protein
MERNRLGAVRPLLHAAWALSVVSLPVPTFLAYLPPCRTAGLPVPPPAPPTEPPPHNGAPKPVPRPYLLPGAMDLGPAPHRQPPWIPSFRLLRDDVAPARDLSPWTPSERRRVWWIEALRRLYPRAAVALLLLPPSRRRQAEVRLCVASRWMPRRTWRSSSSGLLGGLCRDSKTEVMMYGRIRDGRRLTAE